MQMHIYGNKRCTGATCTGDKNNLIAQKEYLDFNGREKITN